MTRAAAPGPLVGLVVIGLVGVGCRLESNRGVSDTWSGGDTGAEVGGRDAQDGVARCAVVTTTEFHTDGAVAVVDVDTLGVSSDVTAVHADAVVRVAGGRVFVVNREGGDSLQELNPYDGFRTSWQRSVGPGANPYGLALLEDGTAWVPLYGPGALQRVDTMAEDGEPFLVGASVPLDIGTDEDGRVEPLDAFVHDGVLYVVVQGLGDYPNCTEASRGWIHAFEPDTLEPAPVFEGEPSLELAACNPRDLAFVGESVIAIGHAGGHRVAGADADDGGLELVDLATGRSLGLVATEVDFGGRDLVGVAFDGARPWIALADGEFGASVHPAVLDPFELGPSAWETDHGGAFDIAARYGHVWIADRTTTRSGLVVLDAATGEHVAGPLDLGFPPFDIDFVELPGGSCEP